MTVTVEDTKEEFQGDGVTVSWPFNFKVAAAADVLVFTTSVEGVDTPMELTTDYTVELNPDQNATPGGTITTVSPIAEGTPGVIMRDMVFEQAEEITAGVPPSVVESVLDRLTGYALQLREKLDRALHVSAAATTFADVNLRNVQTRRNRVIGFDTDGNVVLLQLDGSVVSGAAGKSRTCRVEVTAPAVFRQDSSGDWSHTTVDVSFIWSYNGSAELTRTITVTVNTGSNQFNVPVPVANITVAQDTGKLITKLSSTHNGVSDYIQLAIIRMAAPDVNVGTFTPAWTTGQFTTPPVGDVSYVEATGIITLTVAAALADASATNAMSWDAATLPPSICPAVARTVPCKLRFNDTLLTMGSATVNPDGAVTFAIYDATTGALTSSGFQTGEDKGLPADWCLIYPL